MKICMTTQLTEADGTPMEAPRKEGGPKVPTLLRYVISSGLNAPGSRYAEETQEEKFNRGYLAMRAMREDELDLSAEDIVLIKKCVASSLLPTVVYQVYELLDPKKPL